MPYRLDLLIRIHVALTLPRGNAPSVTREYLLWSAAGTPVLASSNLLIGIRVVLIPRRCPRAYIVRRHGDQVK